ncbi:hypothetical protein D915_010783 [Fasciola hepatica]|uniref:CUB domain-containing protein n=1 Tax=Fasciola hepatica TaxID=6192 RepID=A0A4E0RP56_FASHE|nr:hypothetical protein D915_010783 [Fasciola hepatica]
MLNTEMYILLALVVCTVAAQEPQNQSSPSAPVVPECMGQIKPTAERKVYLAYTTESSPVCTWFVNEPNGTKVTLEIQNNFNASKPCGLSVNENEETYMNCSQQLSYTTSSSTFIIRYNITEQNITYSVVIGE